MQEFIQTWGYVAVFLGSLIEGESVILTAGFLAHQGYLSLPKIIMISFIGTLIADQLLYFLGRSYGERVLDKFPKLREKAERAFKLLHKWDAIFMMSFRFIYGIRIISPVVIGMSGIPPKRFAIYNVLAAAVWAILSCSAGYFLGHLFMDQLDQMPKIILGMAIGAGAVIYLYFHFRKKKSLPKV
ncbi:DedA family protein [Candidatus Bealeia paramacronuclearis]|uniref:DedA family protein n=1 Tax=Candidatus Bealeia paramacronuclearis TaxID=1921001 RepID=A0ABZ2C1K7_9PROT|nr:DedA family protein [Candidatus Bealeia paramacronuclearis]